MNIDKFTFRCLHFILFALLIVVTNVSAAENRKAGDKFTMNIKISGTVVATGTCTFATTGDNTVNFGDIRFNTVNGVTSIETAHIADLLHNTTESCDGDVGGKVQMKLVSTRGDDYINYNGTALLPVYNSDQTKKYPSLGIILSSNSGVINCGQWFDVDPKKLPHLSVSLIQTGDGKDLQTDNIMSSATLTIAFN